MCLAGQRSQRSGQWSKEVLLHWHGPDCCDVPDKDLLLENLFNFKDSSAGYSLKRSPVHYWADTQKQTAMSNLDATSSWHLSGQWKEGTHTDKGTKCKLHTERPCWLKTSPLQGPTNSNSTLIHSPETNTAAWLSVAPADGKDTQEIPENHFCVVP